MSEFLTIGEPLVVFEATDKDEPLDKVTHFNKYLAGAELNVAIGVSRLEHQVEYISAVGNDPFGAFVRTSMQKNKVPTTYIFGDAQHWTGFYLKQRVTKGCPGIYYYRKNSAAANLSNDVIDQVDLTDTKIAHLTGIYAALSEDSIKTYKKLNYRLLKQGVTITFDPNLRPSLWESKQKMICTINELSKESHIVLPGIGEGKILTGYSDPEQIANFYFEQSEITQLVIVKMGPSGAFVKERNGNKYFVPGFKVKHVVDTVGAGDGFAVGLISALLEELPIKEAVRRACAIGAQAVESYGDSDGYPQRRELQLFFEKYKRVNLIS